MKVITFDFKQMPSLFYFTPMRSGFQLGKILVFNLGILRGPPASGYAARQQP
jgi:hypothetical protein